MVKELQAALQHGIDVGVASNTKYTRQIGRGATPHVTAKGMEPRVRTAKILSGRMYERMAEARVIQPEVRPLPTLDIVELYKLPGRRRQDSLSEQDFCRSIEASYAQARHCASHLRYGLRASNARETAARSALRALELEVLAAREALRECRRAVVAEAVRVGETQLLPRAEKHGGREDEVEQGARRRLREVLKQCNELGRAADVPPEDEDGAGWDLLMA
ncbi:hypothetical protein FA09DRAFT_82079 [Tilletiopsis washingtonensis]|uniref:Uncharacterized protein n=1 Tax=Tilletiopsis washingtonensis TaxID=58919 RepID=A0A316Z938_9BASI|nr:hypothetical protein FA09DRAFT_82079 [Tilletiopsis washingtonensis]PWN96683.1 hypothetical protein FA09DRAFT_82079 [Tilletiopsis washingtonensis]